MVTTQEAVSILQEMTTDARKFLLACPDQTVATNFFALRKIEGQVVAAYLNPAKIGYNKQNFGGLLQYLAGKKTIEGCLVVAEAQMVCADTDLSPQSSQEIRQHPRAQEVLIGVISVPLLDQACVYTIHRTPYGDVERIEPANMLPIEHFSGCFTIQWPGHPRESPNPTGPPRVHLKLF